VTTRSGERGVVKVRRGEEKNEFRSSFIQCCTLLDESISIRKGEGEVRRGGERTGQDRTGQDRTGRDGTGDN
jgi:hypothetical protein